MRQAIAAGVFMLTASSVGLVTASASAGVCYSVHVQGDTSGSFRQEVCDGTVTGTVGQSLQMEQIKIRGTESNANMCYRVHVANSGWMSKVCNNAVAGIQGQRIEAIEILDTSVPADQGVQYQVHVQDYGWLPVRWDGAMAGTTGQSRRMEAIAIAVNPRSACPDTDWLNFSNGDGMMAMASDIYPGQAITCYGPSSVFGYSTGGIYTEDTYLSWSYSGNGWFRAQFGNGDSWDVELDRYNNILDAWWNMAGGSSIWLGSAQRRWTITMGLTNGTVLGSGVSMQ